MNAFALRVLEADKPFYEGECLSLIFPAEDGAYGVQAHHRNLISAVVPGLLRFITPDGEHRCAIVGAGMVKVENGRVLVLVDSAESPEELDVRRAKRAADRAKDRLLREQSPVNYRLAQADLTRAMNRLRYGGNKK